MLTNKIDLLRTTADELTDIVYDNEELFMDMFCCRDALDITEIGYGMEYIRFTYVEWEGAHICDNISWEEFKEFLKVVEEE